jgi:DNA anti-recombination protein RmuC
MVGLGSTAEKLTKVAERAEKLYTRMNKLRDEVEETQQTVEGTRTAVESLEDELREQRAVLYELAEQEGIDADAVAAEAHITEAETNGEDDGEAPQGDANSA